MTVPLPESVTIEAPEVVAEMSKVASVCGNVGLEVTIEPVPVSFSVPPLIVVTPV